LTLHTLPSPTTHQEGLATFAKERVDWFSEVTILSTRFMKISRQHCRWPIAVELHPEFCCWEARQVRRERSPKNFHQTLLLNETAPERQR
jgi:hypothetical protein